MGNFLTPHAPCMKEWQNLQQTGQKTLRLRGFAIAIYRAKLGQGPRQIMGVQRLTFDLD
jgi:hypothetical protein